MSRHTLGHINAKLNVRYRERTTFVIVEGADDLAFYRRFFDGRVTSVYYSTKVDEANNVKDGGCEELMHIVDVVLKDGRTDQVLGIIDTDCRKYRRHYKYPQNIFHTDRRDLEMTALDTASVRRALCAWIKDFDNTLNNLEPVLKHTGKLRIVNDLFNIGCNFKRHCKISCTFDEVNHCIYSDWKRRYNCAFIKSCYNRRRQAKTDALKTLMRLCISFIYLKCHPYRYESVYDICQGHDAVHLLSMSLVNTAIYSETAIWERCFDAYTVADFRCSNLYSSIDEWQKTKGQSIFTQCE